MVFVGWAGPLYCGGSLLAIVVFEGSRSNEPAFGQANAPFLAVGIVGVFANRIVGHDVKNQVRRAVIGELVGFTRRKDEGVPGFDGIGTAVVTDEAGASQDSIFPNSGAVIT